MPRSRWLGRRAMMRRATFFDIRSPPWLPSLQLPYPQSQTDLGDICDVVVSQLEPGNLYTFSVQSVSLLDPDTTARQVTVRAGGWPLDESPLKIQFPQGRQIVAATVSADLSSGTHASRAYCRGRTASKRLDPRPPPWGCRGWVWAAK
jgi:hypothetical protein